MRSQESRLENMFQLRELTQKFGKAITHPEECEDENILDTIEMIFDFSPFYAEIIDKDGNMIYVSPKIKEEMKDSPKFNGLCFESMWGRDKPCDNCPAFESLEKKRTVSTIRMAWGRKFKMTAIPLFDNGASAVLVLAEEVEF